MKFLSSMLVVKMSAD